MGKTEITLTCPRTIRYNHSKRVLTDGRNRIPPIILHLQSYRWRPEDRADGYRPFVVES